MAISFAQNYFRNSAGVQWEILGRLSLDNSYPTGGYLIDPLQFGLSQITNFSVTDNVSGYGFDYNATTQKLLVYQAGTGGVLAAHSHDLQQVNISDAFAVGRVYVTAVSGPFTIGEDVTDGHGNTAVYSGSGVDPDGVTYFNFSNYAGQGLYQGDTLTGTTSGETASCETTFVGVVQPVGAPFFLSGVSTCNNAGTDLNTCNQAAIKASNATRIVVRSPEDPEPICRYIPSLNEIEVTAQVNWIGRGGYNIDYITAPTTSVSGGTVTGGGEVTNGTDLSAITNVEYRVVGL